MPTQVLMPQLGESVVEGVVSKWLVAEGQPTLKDAPLLQVVTDKIETEIPAPASGILRQVIVREGETAATGAVLAVIEAEGAREPAPAGAANVGFISPAVGRLAAEHGVDLAQVAGTGDGGRITRKDVLAFVAGRAVAQPAGSPPAAPQEPDAPVPLSPMRLAIARHMARSVQVAPQATTVMEADLTRVVAARERLRDEFAQQNVRLTFTPFFIQAIVVGLRVTPEANSSFRDDALLIHRRLHIGVAVALPDGLIVPVVRDADRLSLLELARTVNDLVERARRGRLAADETQGGTFTLTNHGTAGSLLATPILMPSQTGILGVGAIQKRPVVIGGGRSLLPAADDAIAIRPMAYLSFTFDHRVLDGQSADRFLAAVKEFLENHQP